MNIERVTWKPWPGRSGATELDGVGEPALGSGPGMEGKMVGRWCMITWGGGRAAGGRARRPHHVDSNERGRPWRGWKEGCSGSSYYGRVGSWSGRRTPWNRRGGGWFRRLRFHRIPYAAPAISQLLFHDDHLRVARTMPYVFCIRLATRVLHGHRTIIHERELVLPSDLVRWKIFSCYVTDMNPNQRH